MKTTEKTLIVFIALLLIQGATSASYEVTPYNLIGYRDIERLVSQIKASEMYNTLFKIKNVFDEYPRIPKVQCPSETSRNKACKSYLIEVANFDKGQEYVNSLPTVFIIAGFHGNEVTGTNAVYQFLRIISKYYYKNVELFGLLENVRLLILPTANVNGFDRLVREESLGGRSYDPNRDFPYDLKRRSRCFKTTTAMIIDAIFRENMIVGCLTFHGGGNSITYPWGNFAHKNKPKTGDHVAFAQVAKILQSVASDNKALGVNKYKIGLMQDVVYDVRGGFEDWAYGASWDNAHVNRRCAKNYGFSPLMKSKMIEYSPETNRAFVYLVEAGEYKVPQPNTLGNELSIFDTASERAILGNVSRNIVLIMKFIEVIQPQLIVSQLEFSNTLVIKFVIRGCLNVSAFRIADFKYTILEQRYNSYSNENLYKVSIEATSNYVEEVKINFSCDDGWKEKFEPGIPRTHLVNMRTNAGYKKEFNGYKLQSQTNMSAKILNIKQTDLKSTYLHMSPQNIYSVVYSPSYKTDLKGEKVLLTYTDGMMYAQMGDGSKPNYDLAIAKYGTIGCDRKKANGGRSLRVVNPQEDTEMSYQTFLDMLGHTIEFKDPQTHETVHSSIIEPASNDQYSALYIPETGLTCSSKDNKTYYYVTMEKSGPLEIRVSVLTTYQGSLVVEANGLKYALSKDSTFTSKEPEVSAHIGTIVAQNANQLRLWGARVKLLDVSSVAVFKCLLNVLNPDYNEADNLSFEAVKKEAQPLPPRPSVKIDKSFLILLGIILLLAVGIIGFITRHSRAEPLKLAKADELDLTRTRDTIVAMM